MNRFLTCCLIFILGCATTSKMAIPTPDPLPNGDISMNDFLRDAIYYGLQADAAPKEMVDKVLKGKLFVTKCPICRPVEAGLEKHLKKLPEIKVKRGKEDVVAKMMNADTRESQQTALRDLISEYIEQYYTLLKFTPEARAKMESELQNGRKKGMGLKSDSFGKFCPSCDGACKIKMKE